MHFGIISPPVPGHIHPFGALGRELIARGHRVTMLHMEDVRLRAHAEELEFAALGRTDHPPGSLPESLARLGRLNGFPALRFTIEAVRKTTEMFCRDAPEAIRQTGIHALLVDQTEPAGGSIADRLNLPFITICNALHLNEEPDIPPPFTGWGFHRSWPARARNRIGYSIAQILMRPVDRVVQEYRAQWNLRSYSDPRMSFSTLAQISQLPACLDYPRTALPDIFHYAGPLRKPAAMESPFPWDRLDGRRLVYASLGTLQNRRERVFRMFSEACLSNDAQLVIAGFDPEKGREFPGQPIVVNYAPQLAVLRKAALTLTHGGLNTVLDSLTCGVPLVSTPINYEQPAIAERVRWAGAGEIVPFQSLTVGKLADAIKKVFDNPSYKLRSLRIAESIRGAGGVRLCADLVEGILRNKKALKCYDSPGPFRTNAL